MPFRTFVAAQFHRNHTAGKKLTKTHFHHRCLEFLHRLGLYPDEKTCFVHGWVGAIVKTAHLVLKRLLLRRLLHYQKCRVGRGVAWTLLQQGH